MQKYITFFKKKINVCVCNTVCLNEFFESENSICFIFGCLEKQFSDSVSVLFRETGKQLSEVLVFGLN